MKNADDSTNTHKDAKRPNHQRWAQFVEDLIRHRKERKAQKEEKIAIDKAAIQTARATIWIGVFTMVIAGVGYKQWKELEGSGRQTDQLLCLDQRQLGQMAVLASAANTSAKDTEEFFRTDERAWIVVDGIDKTSFPPTATFRVESFKYKLWPKNVGRTAALNVHIFVENPGDG